MKMSKKFKNPRCPSNRSSRKLCICELERTPKRESRRKCTKSKISSTDENAKSISTKYYKSKERQASKHMKELSKSTRILLTSKDTSRPSTSSQNFHNRINTERYLDSGKNRKDQYKKCGCLHTRKQRRRIVAFSRRKTTKRKGESSRYFKKLCFCIGNRTSIGLMQSPGARYKGCGCKYSSRNLISPLCIRKRQQRVNYMDNISEECILSSTNNSERKRDKSNSPNIFVRGITSLCRGLTSIFAAFSDKEKPVCRCKW